MASVLLLGVFLFVLAMTHFEPLHHAVHPDSDQSDHQCLVTMIHSGQMDTPLHATICVIACPLVKVAGPSFVHTIYVSFDFALLPSCGPPSILS